MVNRVILVGNIGGDPETRTLDNGAQVANFSLATNESYRDKSGEWQQNTEWHSIVAWRQLAEKAEKMSKGQPIYLEGKLQTRTWQDQNGNNRKTTEVVASYFRSVGKNESGQSGSGQNNQQNKSSNSQLETASSSGEKDDLPF